MPLPVLLKPKGGCRRRMKGDFRSSFYSVYTGLSLTHYCSQNRIVELSQALDQKIEQLTAVRGVQLEYVIMHVLSQ
jgi:hypothetical protein